MAIAAACVGFLAPRTNSWCIPSSVEGQLGLRRSPAKAVKRYDALCRAAQSSSSSSQRHVVITGGNTGIGKATATELARQGMAVTIGSMPEIGERGASSGGDCSSIRTAPLDFEIFGRFAVVLFRFAQIVFSLVGLDRVMQLDLASFDSIRQFVAEYLDLGLPLNSLVNNAGVMACPQQYTVDGFEYQLGVNHLGHFLVTALLLTNSNHVPHQEQSQEWWYWPHW